MDTKTALNVINTLDNQIEKIAADNIVTDKNSNEKRDPYDVMVELAAKYGEETHNIPKENVYKSQ